MPATDTHPSRTRQLLGRIVAGLAGAGIAVAITMPTAGQASDTRTAEARAEVRAEVSAEVRAAATAAASYADFATAPKVEADLFRTFLNCLAAANHSDSMYPGIDPSEVNSCLEDHGVL